MSFDIEAAISAVEPDTPFRFARGYQHSTWARTFHSFPELYIRPESVQEVQKAVKLARRCGRRLTTVGCGHSPSDLTCTSSWMMNLDRFNRVLSADGESGMVVMQSGIRLHDLGEQLKESGLTMPNLGSIDHQAIAGAMATATHGSTLRHGLLSENVVALKMVLADGSLVECSVDERPELFRAALVSLGALGVIVEVTFQADKHFDIEWEQTLVPLDDVLASWETDLWTTAEFTRVWWLPYQKRMVRWRGDKTTKPHQPPKSNFYGGAVGFHAYHIMLYAAQWVPGLLPSIERFVFGMQYGFKDGVAITAVEEGRTGLLMNCLYSQFVNEWAIPLSKGPEAITRLSAWLHGHEEESGIPISSRGVYVHAPIEVRVSNTTNDPQRRPYLDNTAKGEPTLYLNATLYRPYGADPPCRERYYAAFEYLMRQLGGRPHWAKNFTSVTAHDIEEMYGEDLTGWRRVRDEVDPDGVFVGDWHRRYLLPEAGNEKKGAGYTNEETTVARSRNHKQGGWTLYGQCKNGGR